MSFKRLLPIALKLPRSHPHWRFNQDSPKASWNSGQETAGIPVKHLSQLRNQSKVKKSKLLTKSCSSWKKNQVANCCFLLLFRVMNQGNRHHSIRAPRRRQFRAPNRSIPSRHQLPFPIYGHENPNLFNNNNTATSGLIVGVTCHIQSSIIWESKLTIIWSELITNHYWRMNKNQVSRI